MDGIRKDTLFIFAVTPRRGVWIEIIATEITVIISGKVRMFDKEWNSGDIVVAEPGDATAFTALEDSVNVVVKIPGANDDKYLVEE